jgi:hypothetical protein
VALPLYVVLPNHYAAEFGIPLATLGALLLGARLLDAVADPLIGRWVDGWFTRRAALAFLTPVRAHALLHLTRAQDTLALALVEARLGDRQVEVQQAAADALVAIASTLPHAVQARLGDAFAAQAAAKLPKRLPVPPPRAAGAAVPPRRQPRPLSWLHHRQRQRHQLLGAWWRVRTAMARGAAAVGSAAQQPQHQAAAAARRRPTPPCGWHCRSCAGHCQRRWRRGR